MAPKVEALSPFEERGSSMRRDVPDHLPRSRRH